MENEALKAIVVEALFKGIEEKKREELVKAALTSLLEEKSSNWGPRKSDLQRAFDEAIYSLARETVRDYVQKDERWNSELKKVIEAALNRVLANDSGRETLIGQIANAIQIALTPK